MNRLITVSALTAGLLISGIAVADHPVRGKSFVDRARVIKVRPIRKTVEVPVTETVCRKRHRKHDYEHARDGERDRFVPTVAGAVVGGVVGHQFGRGDGKDVATVAGAVIGATVGHELARAEDRKHGEHRKHRKHRHGKRCRTVTRYQTREEVVAYRVKYRYKGETYKTRMHRRPGKFIRLRVTHEPIRF